MSMKSRKNTTESSMLPLFSTNGSSSSSSNSGSNKKVRMIRKTLDLICFESSLSEDKNDCSFVNSKRKVNMNESNCNKDKIRKGITSKLKNIPNFECVSEQKENLPVDCENYNYKRKIVKAKRILKNKPKQRLETSEDSVEISFSPKKHELVVTTLFSPISPSENNIETILKSFHSSQEQLLPSTEGSVEISTKRHTFELENSTNGRLPPKSSGNINESKTPQPSKFSKVTVRRKWKKFNSPMPCSDSPSWINKIEKTQQTPNSQEKNTPVSKTSSSKKFVSKVKVPNFTVIHQKALAKMESIDEYKERKENRAKMLLSGKKPEAKEKSERKVNRKNLRFAANTLDTEKSPTFIPLPSTPLPKRALNVDVENSKNHQILIPFTWIPSKIPRFDLCKDNVAKTPKFEKPLEIKKGTLRSFNLQKNEIFKNTLNVPQRDVKTIMNKNKLRKNTLETRRCTIKGVRSNRRFELLMNMRKGQ